MIGQGVSMTGVSAKLHELHHSADCNKHAAFYTPLSREAAAMARRGELSSFADRKTGQAKASAEKTPEELRAMPRRPGWEPLRPVAPARATPTRVSMNGASGSQGSRSGATSRGRRKRSSGRRHPRKRNAHGKVNHDWPPCRAGVKKQRQVQEKSGAKKSPATRA
jgi:hypothetical protein